MRPVVLPSPIVVSAPTDVSALPVYELERSRVIKPHAPIRFDPRTGYRGKVKTPVHAPLPIHHWHFLHAWAKTRFQSLLTPAAIESLALSHRPLSERALVWNGGNLRTANRGVFQLKDASMTNLTAAIAESCAALLMHREGYVYWDHLPTLIGRALATGYGHAERTRRARAIISRIKRSKPQKQPDYIFEQRGGESALVESKGILVSPGEHAPVKTRLRLALRQLDGWTRYISPTPAKLLGIASVLREVRDPEDSHLAFVDPEGDGPDENVAVPLGGDWVRRGSYGNWLSLMGLDHVGETLRWRDIRKPGGVGLVVIRVGNHSFAMRGFIVRQPLLAGVGLRENVPVSSDFVTGSLRGVVSSSREVFLFVIGIDVRILNAIAECIGGGGSLDVRPLTYEVGDDDAWTGSIFPDGTAIGMYRLSTSPEQQLQWQVFNL
jgi:hypothetical protein